MSLFYAALLGLIVFGLLRASRTVGLAARLSGFYAVVVFVTTAVAIAFAEAPSQTAVVGLAFIMVWIGEMSLLFLLALIIGRLPRMNRQRLPLLSRQLVREEVPSALCAVALAKLLGAGLHYAGFERASDPASVAAQALVSGGLAALAFFFLSVNLAAFREGARLSSAAAALPARDRFDFDIARSLLALTLTAFCLFALAGTL